MFKLSQTQEEEKRVGNKFAFLPTGCPTEPFFSRCVGEIADFLQKVAFNIEETVEFIIDSEMLINMLFYSLKHCLGEKHNLIDETPCFCHSKARVNIFLNAMVSSFPVLTNEYIGLCIHYYDQDFIQMFCEICEQLLQ